MAEPMETIVTAPDLLSEAALDQMVITIPVSDAMHKRVVAMCERRGVDIAIVIEDLLERHFPPPIVTALENAGIDECASGRGKLLKPSWQMRLIFRRRRSR